MSKSIPVSHCPHVDGAVPCLQLNYGFLPFPWCGKWDPMLIGALENRGSSTTELSVKDAGFAAEFLESSEEFVFVCESGLCEDWKGSTGGALWSVLSCCA